MMKKHFKIKKKLAEIFEGNLKISYFDIFQINKMWKNKKQEKHDLLQTGQDHIFLALQKPKEF